jgi:hypothetical protein
LHIINASAAVTGTGTAAATTTTATITTTTTTNILFFFLYFGACLLHWLVLHFNTLTDEEVCLMCTIK